MKAFLITLPIFLGGCSNLPQAWSEDEIREIAAEAAETETLFGDDTIETDVRDLAERLDALESEQSDLEMQLSAAQLEIADLRSQVANHELMYDHY